MNLYGNSWNTSTLHPKFSHLLLSKVQRACACAHVDERDFLATVFEDVCTCDREMEKQVGKTVSKDQMYF